MQVCQGQKELLEEDYNIPLHFLYLLILLGHLISPAKWLLLSDCLRKARILITDKNYKTRSNSTVPFAEYLRKINMFFRTWPGKATFGIVLTISSLFATIAIYHSRAQVSPQFSSQIAQGQGRTKQKFKLKNEKFHKEQKGESLFSAKGYTTLSDMAPPLGQYTPLAQGQKVVGLDGDLAAQFATPPPELSQQISVWSPPSNAEPDPPDAVAFEFVSSVRYQGSSGMVVITTLRPNANAADVKILSRKEEKLSNGNAVNVIEDCKKLAKGAEPESCASPDNPTPNQVIFINQGLIISVESSLSIPEVKKLASSIELL
jgi:hypothetical protein